MMYPAPANILGALTRWTGIEEPLQGIHQLQPRGDLRPIFRDREVQVGWWSPVSDEPGGVSSQPAVGSAARLPDAASNADGTPSNPTNAPITYMAEGYEFQWGSLNNNKLVITDRNDNDLAYAYVVRNQSSRNCSGAPSGYAQITGTSERTPVREEGNSMPGLIPP